MLVKVREILVNLKGPRDNGQRSERYWSISKVREILVKVREIVVKLMIDQHLSDLLEWPISLGLFWPKSLGPFCSKFLTKLEPQLLTTTDSLNTPLKRNKSRLNKIVFYYKIHIEDTLASYSTDFLKFFGRVKGPLKLKFANDFIVYQKFPFRGRIVPGRLHSELCSWVT